MEINSVSDALAYLYQLSIDKANYCFRGQSNFSWSLQPTIYRYQGFERFQTVKYEEHILGMKPKSPCPPLLHTEYGIEWLMLCQHYGVPTRLLDWSQDILVSLFFACSDPNELKSDGALFICDETEFPRFSAYNSRLNEIQELAFINTYIVNPRVRTQSGVFMIWGHSPLCDDTKESYDLWDYIKTKKTNASISKLCIPSKRKNKILLELKNTYSISNESVYLRHKIKIKSPILNQDNMGYQQPIFQAH